jgi:predicted aspartyl protease
MRRLPLRILVLFLLARAPQAFARAQDVHPTLEEVLAGARAAVAWEELGRSGGLRLTGEASTFGVPCEFELVVQPNGWFAFLLDSRWVESMGFDGTTLWARERSGVARVVCLGERDEVLVAQWVLQGSWLRAQAPLELERMPNGDDAASVALVIRMRGAPEPMTLHLDRRDLLPRELSKVDEAGKQTWAFADWREAQGTRFPHAISLTNENSTPLTFAVERVEPMPSFLRSPFAVPTSAPTDTTFDLETESVLETERALTGHLLVHPLVDGEDVGWFILDSGAGALVLDPELADELGHPSFGEVSAVGAAGLGTAHYRSAKSFSLGPLTIREPIYVDLDLSFLRPFFEVDVVGIAGYDVFARAVVEIDPASDEVSLHDPTRFTLERGNWEGLMLERRTPCVEARFDGDRRGIFRLDTGASGTVAFHAPAVAELRLLEGRETTPGAAGGVGGAGEFRAGRIAWFELGPRRFDSPTVLFTKSGSGALADAYTTGNIGQDFLRTFRLIFDYPHGRLALVPREDG